MLCDEGLCHIDLCKLFMSGYFIEDGRICLSRYDFSYLAAIMFVNFSFVILLLLE